MVVKSAFVSSVSSEEELQGFKKTEIGLVPLEWGIEKIGAMVAIKTGSRNTQDHVDDGVYPFFVRSQKVERINSFSYDTEAVLTAGDGVGTGKVFHYVKGRFDVHQRVYCITDFSPCLNARYFFYQFSRMFYNRISSMTAKSSVDSVRMDMISEMLIPVPPIDEQRDIATVLSNADALIESLNSLIAKKKVVKLALMQQLLSGKMRLPGFTEDWQVSNLGSILSFLKHASNPRADLGISGSVLYVHYGDVHSHKTPILDCATTALPLIQEFKVAGIPRLRNGDLLLADASEDLVGIGKSVEVKNIEGTLIVAGLHTIAARGEETDWAMGFKAYLQFVPKFKRALERAASGISVYSISKRNVAEISMPLPSVEEQRAIVQILSDMEEEVVAIQQRLLKFKEMKQGMMQFLLTGKLRLVEPEANA